MRRGAASRLPSARRHLSRSQSHNDKVLPLTPTSDLSREGTPIIQVEDVEVPFFEDAGRCIYTENETSTELDSVEGTPETGTDRSQHVGQGAEESLKPLLRHSHSTKSQLGGGAGRKPLPALPEDPS